MSGQALAHHNILCGVVCHPGALSLALLLLPAVPWTVAVLLLIVILIIAVVPINGKP